MPARVPDPVLFTTGPKGELFSPPSNETCGFSLTGPTEVMCKGRGMSCTGWLRSVLLAHSGISPSHKEDDITPHALGLWGPCLVLGGRIVFAQTAWLLHLVRGKVKWVMGGHPEVSSIVSSLFRYLKEDL